MAITSSDTATYIAWQDSRNGNAVTNVEDIYFASLQHTRPVTQSDEHVYVRDGAEVSPLSFGPGWQLGHQ